MRRMLLARPLRDVAEPRGQHCPWVTASTEPDVLTLLLHESSTFMIPSGSMMACGRPWRRDVDSSSLAHDAAAACVDATPHDWQHHKESVTCVDSSASGRQRGNDTRDDRSLARNEERDPSILHGQDGGSTGCQSACSSTQASQSRCDMLGIRCAKQCSSGQRTFPLVASSVRTDHQRL